MFSNRCLQVINSLINAHSKNSTQKNQRSHKNILIFLSNRTKKIRIFFLYIRVFKTILTIRRKKIIIN